MIKRQDPAQRLAAAAGDGGITLVLGAGVSITRGVPGWGAVTAHLWSEAFPDSPLPPLSGTAQAFPLALELCARQLGAAHFVSSLKARLYRDLRMPSRAESHRANDTLGVLARLATLEHARGSERRIVRIISFNADDLLEQAVGALAPRVRVLKPIVRASQSPERGVGQQPIPVYHLHGYLPQNPRAKWHHGAPDSLVFTDAQYWSGVAEPMGFANRVMNFALHDSRCIFLGLSMTDLNLMRWLAVRTNQIETDKTTQFGQAPEADTRRAIRRAMDRHFWIRPDSDDPSGFTSRWLALRGVEAVPLPDWSGDHLSALFGRCFQPP